MATQFHVAYSSQIMGVATLSGAPYYCAGGSVLTAAGVCLSSPGGVNMKDLFNATSVYASCGAIDDPSNMADHRVYVLHGTNDTVVNSGVKDLIVEYYSKYMSSANIKTEFTIASGHGHPTMDYGIECSQTMTPYINRCNFDSSFELLDWIYGGSLTRPNGSVPLLGDFYEFDQNEFFYNSPPSASSMDTVGYVYVPSHCINFQTPCKLHVVFHGCRMGRYLLKDVYARHAGYNEVGELNNIIILYPQLISQAIIGNPLGCWDWWGYTVDFYATKYANQTLAVIRMVKKLQGLDAKDSDGLDDLPFPCRASPALSFHVRHLQYAAGVLVIAFIRPTLCSFEI